MRSALVVMVTSVAIGCGPEITASGLVHTTSADDSGESETTWLIITAIVAATTLVGLVSLITDGELFAYMQRHQKDVRRALASGDGPFPSDLASGLGLPAAEVSRVARLLREGRSELDPHLADGPITREGVHAFWRALLGILAADPVTGPKLERLRQRAHALIAQRTRS